MPSYITFGLLEFNRAQLLEMAEFFAVATESFFEKPWQMKKHTPQLYDELQRFYGFDPANAPMCGRRDH